MDVGHSNVYVKNLPSAVDEPTLNNLFQTYGTITSCRIMGTRNPGGHNFGFVRFATTQEAMAAIEGMNGAQVGDLTIEVKFAHADVGQRQGKGGQGGEDAGPAPSDNLYVRGFPGTWSDTDLQGIFLNIGTIVECRVLYSKEPGRGGVGLVRMSSPLEAANAISALNGKMPNGCLEPLLVKYADSPADKERKARHKQPREARFSPYQKPGGGGVVLGATGIPNQNPGMITPLGANGTDHLGQIALQGHLGVPAPDQAINALAMQTPGLGLDGSALNQLALQSPGLLGVPGQPGAANLMAAGGALSAVGGAAVGGAGAGAPSCSVYIRNLPPDADKLYLYEHFAPYGGVASVKLLFNESGNSRGIGFVNYTDHASALMAIQALNNAKLGDKPLHVSLQTQRKDRKGL
ncbi:unnamed protein product [Ostreobium quekettii]|uniref:RRM domain-containing protein n=1 Tax=Ostreobium quekettii TaxID=121088 RepID=A0A8S1J356_9CHLO|nr:unnamed protein product [Ostreobium quekettii]|eukprot:evm.model.scf_359.1 EVM.evm.TU.scf_359.1   scf_359:12256-13473(-)